MSFLRVAVAVALGVLAGSAFGPAFGGMTGDFLLVLGGTCAAAGFVALAAAAFPRLPSALVAVAGAVAVVLTAMILTGTRAGVLDGPWQLLTGAVPAEPAGPPLAAAAVVAGWLTLAAGLLAAYATRPLTAAAPPLAGLLLALALGASGPPLPGWYPLPLVALLVALLIAARPAPPPLAALAGGVLTAAVAVVAAALIGPAAPSLGRPPADPRDLIAGPIQPRTGVSPLQQYLALRNGTQALRLTGTTSRPGSLLRMATLTRFDGVYWTVDGDFRRAGTTLPAGGPASERRLTVTQRVRVEAGELDWLVTAGRPTGLSVPGLGVDEATGDVAVPADTAPPDGYTATSVVTEASFDEVLAADPATAPGTMPAPPAQLRSFLDTAVAGWPAGSDQLLALYRHFRTEGGFRYDQSAEAAGGHGYFRIQRLLTDKRGTSEQYASAYATMARQLGFDARVVMGLRARYDGEAFVAEGKDVDAWVEVRFNGLGWISIDPSPRENPIGTRPDAPPAASRSTPLDDPLRDADQTPPPATAEPAVEDGEEAAAGADQTAAGPATPLVVALGAGILVLLLAAPPAAKAIRRVRRRRARSDRQAVLGAWRETLDRLQEAGVHVGPARTTGEVALAGGAAGALPALAAAVDRAAYAPEEPDPGLRDQAWVAAAHVRAQVRAGMPWLRRLWAVLDPRPLLR